VERQRSLRWEERLRATQSSLGTQEPILALRRQLASLSGGAAEAGECWLQLAKLCRSTGHYEAATTAVLEAVASRVPSAPLEQLQLLWDKGQPYRAVSEAQLLARQARERSLAAPFARAADHARFHAAVALQLAQWMAETGQAAKDDIVGGSPAALACLFCMWQQAASRADARFPSGRPPVGGLQAYCFPPAAAVPSPQSCLSRPPAWSQSPRRCCSATLCTWMRCVCVCWGGEGWKSVEEWGVRRGRG
jgi:hypothetical protein